MNDPSSPGRVARAARWRRARRLLQRAVVLLAALIVLLQTPPARRLVARALTATASRALGGEVELEGLDYRSWAGEATAVGLVLRRPGLEIRCARAELNAGPFQGLDVRIQRPG